MVQTLTSVENSIGIRENNGERILTSPGSKDRGMVEEKRRRNESEFTG